jgi:hypothetical protein
MVWTKTSDGSIVDQNGKVIFFSTRRFIDDICIGNCCFMRSKARGKAVQRRACFPGMATPACLETILADVCLLGDDNDVPPIRQHRVGNLAGGGGEFLNSSEDHAAERADAVA